MYAYGIKYRRSQSHSQIKIIAVSREQEDRE